MTQMITEKKKILKYALSAVEGVLHLRLHNSEVMNTSPSISSQGGPMAHHSERFIYFMKHNTEIIPIIIRQLYLIVEELETLFPGRHFTPTIEVRVKTEQVMKNTKHTE